MELKKQMQKINLNVKEQIKAKLSERTIINIAVRFNTEKELKNMYNNCLELLKKKDVSKEDKKENYRIFDLLKKALKKYNKEHIMN